MIRTKRGELYALLLAFAVVVALGIFIALRVSATASGLNGNARLVIFDTRDPEAFPNNNTLINTTSQFSFFANYTNSTNFPINSSNGAFNCSIIFNFTGTPTSSVNMSYNTTSRLWQTNRTFNYKGNHQFNVSCLSTYGNISLIDNFTVINSAPFMRKNIDNTVDLDNNPSTPDSLACTEDALCIYNISGNVSDPDFNDVLVYNYTTVNLTLTNFSINSATGLLSISINTSTEAAGDKQIELTVRDTNNDLASGFLRISYASINDAPVFVNLQNQSFNISTLFNYDVQVTDEENNNPYHLNISFLNCSVAPWSSRNCNSAAGRQLFNSSQYSFNATSGALNINFTPFKNDVGNYTINFTVIDGGTPNATTSRIITFFVNNINDPPYFTSLCETQRNATEGSPFLCGINVTDVDENNNLTIVANQSFFTFTPSTIGVNITTAFNGTFLANFTATDSAVGNWSINLTVQDTGNPQRINSSIISFFVANINDSVTLAPIPNFTAYTTNNYTIIINATDDDLLVPDKSVFNETIFFSSNLSCVAATSLGQVAGTNRTRLQLSIASADSSCFTGGQFYNVRINASDANNFSQSSRVFTITVISNNPPSWNGSVSTTLALTEDAPFLINLTQNTSDPNSEPLRFSFSNTTIFPSFSLNETTGIISFTPRDEDVGQHIVTLFVADNATSVGLDFNFTVAHVNDMPSFELPLGVSNGVVDSNSNIETNENSATGIDLYIRDNDLKIPGGQKNFYNESLIANVTIQGPNPRLFTFVVDPSFPPAFPDNNANRSHFTASFQPNKSDTGVYNVTINVTDRANLSIALSFNLTVFAVNNTPVLMNVTNHTYAINQTFYYDINATDVEDGTEAGGNLAFSYVFLNGSNILNSTTFNNVTGLINITFNSTMGGLYRLNVTVRDSTNLNNSKDFWLAVYDTPHISLAEEGTTFNLVENVLSSLNFSANHSVRDNLTYVFSLNETVRYNVTSYGNGLNTTWAFTPNFTDETYGHYTNLTLVVYSALFPELNRTRTWNTNITHTNAPLVFSSAIGNQQGVVGNNVTLNLTNFFSDIDASDSAYNQTLNFTITRNDSTSVGFAIVNSYLLIFNASAAASESFSITARDLNSSGANLSSASSNAFVVSFVEGTSSSGGGSSSSSSGGGGGSTSTTYAPLRIILPGPLSARSNETIEAPITLVNEAGIPLNGISLSSAVTSDGVPVDTIVPSLSVTSITSLAPRERREVVLLLRLTGALNGSYDISVNASVQSPRYSDWGKIFLTVEQSTIFDQRLLFVEELVISNPACLELRERLELARNYRAQGEEESSEQVLEEVLNGCRTLLAQASKARPANRFGDDFFRYVFLATAGSFAFGLAYYLTRRLFIQRSVTSYVQRFKNSPAQSGTGI